MDFHGSWQPWFTVDVEIAASFSGCHPDIDQPWLWGMAAWFQNFVDSTGPQFSSVFVLSDDITLKMTILWTPKP